MLLTWKITLKKWGFGWHVTVTLHMCNISGFAELLPRFRFAVFYLNPEFQKSKPCMAVSLSCGWLAPSAAGAVGELRGIFLLWWCLAQPQHSRFHSSVFSLVTQRSFPKPLRTFSIQLRLVSNWEEDIQPLVGSWKHFARCVCEVQLICMSSAQLQPQCILTVSGFSCSPFRHTHLYQRSTLGPCLTLCIKIPATYHNNKKVVFI